MTKSMSYEEAVRRVGDDQRESFPEWSDDEAVEAVRATLTVADLDHNDTYEAYKIVLGMRYEDVHIGQDVIVTSRGNLSARVVSKFLSQQASPYPDGAPAGTPYVALRADNGTEFFNHPSQLQLDDDGWDDINPINT